LIKGVSEKAVTIVVVLFTLNSVNAQNQLLIPPALEGLDMNRRTVLMPPEMVEMAVVQGHGMVLKSIELSL
jgi:hypothetical protein